MIDVKFSRASDGVLPPFSERLRLLRAYYPAQNNRIGGLLDELIKDVEAEAPRKEIKADCRALLKELEEDTSAAKAIREFLTLKKKRARKNA